LNNTGFTSLKVPLCIRIDIYNRSNICERIVTSSGIIQLDENDLVNVFNVSICLDQYEDYCGKSIPVEMSRKAMSCFYRMFFFFSFLQNVKSLLIGYLF
jgi:hypothetical protein